MQWELIVALIIVIPVILFPAAFVWYLNLGGIVHAMREARVAKTVREEKAETVTVATK